MAAAKVLCPMEAWEPWAVEAASPALVRGERVLATQHGVGLYAGDTKVAERSAGTRPMDVPCLRHVPRYHDTRPAVPSLWRDGAPCTHAARMPCMYLCER